MTPSAELHRPYTSGGGLEPRYLLDWQLSRLAPLFSADALFSSMTQRLVGDRLRPSPKLLAV